MKGVRYPDFATDPASYDASVREWQALWASIDAFARELHEWTEPWLDTSMRDGNPIFSAWSPSLRCGVRIIQHRDPTMFAVWRNTFAKGTSDAVDELVIDCALTDEHLYEARRMVAEWVLEASASTRGRPSPSFDVAVLDIPAARAA